MMAVRIDDIRRASELLERYRKDGQAADAEIADTDEFADAESDDSTAELLEEDL